MQFVLLSNKRQKLGLRGPDHGQVGWIPRPALAGQAGAGSVTRGKHSEGVKKLVFIVLWPFQDGSLSATLKCGASSSGQHVVAARVGSDCDSAE